MMTTATIYTRFSPRRGEHSESCETQEHYCREYVERRGYTVRDVYADEGLSGADEDRPGLWSAVESLHRGDVLVVWRYDRLARDVYLSEYIQREIAKRGATLEAVQGGADGDTPEDRLVRQILQAFAEYERRVTAVRTKYAMLRYQREGRLMGQCPIGMKIAGEDAQGRTLIEPDDDMRRYASQARVMRDDGWSYRRIARLFTESGVGGRAWNHGTIRRLIEAFPEPRHESKSLAPSNGNNP